jgi:hypothetical protein
MDIGQLAGALRDPDTGRFVAAWLRWRKDGLLPRRGDMDLRDIVRVLERVTLFEVRGPDDIAIRLAGTALRDLVELDLTGKNFRDVTAPEEWPTRRQRMLGMSETPCGGFMSYRDAQPTGRVVVFEAVTLPLVADQPGAPRLLLSCSSLLARSFQAPQQEAPRTIPAAGSFAYVDIGAGVPVAAV